MTKSESKAISSKDGKLSRDDCRYLAEPEVGLGVRCVERGEASFQIDKYSIVTTVVDKRWTGYVN